MTSWLGCSSTPTRCPSQSREDREGARQQCGLQIKTRLAVRESSGGDGVHISFAKEYVRLPPNLDLSPIVRVEQHPITDLDGTYIGTSGDHPCPRQPPAHLCRRRNHDPGRRTPLACVAVHSHEDPVVEHADRQFVEVLPMVTHNNERTKERRPPSRSGGYGARS